MKRLILIACILLLAACGTAPAAQVVTTSVPPKASATAAAAPGHFKIGQTIKTGDGVWLITLVQVKEAPDQVPITPGDVYLLIEVKMGNISSASQNADAIFYEARDSAGNKYTAQIGLPSAYPDFSGQVASQQLAHGWLGFEVPPDQHSFLLNYNDFINSIFWDITV